jgi:hypothetical protein
LAEKGLIKLTPSSAVNFSGSGDEAGFKEKQDSIRLGNLGESKKTQQQSDQVPILPKVINIGLQIFVTYTFYIFVTFNQYSLVHQFFFNNFEPIV